MRRWVFVITALIVLTFLGAIDVAYSEPGVPIQLAEIDDRDGGFEWG